MTIRGKHLIAGLMLGLAACANLAAGSLPAGDSLFMQPNPLNGAVNGLPGATVGWGFTVNWTSTNGDWISFTGSSLGSAAPGGNETNPSVLALYTDFIGLQGGPDDFAVGPSDSPWTETFDGVSQGIGSYLITSDPSQAGANDSGQITIDFDLYNGDPLGPGTYLASYSYYGPSTEFSVTVDAPAPGSATPEPATGTLCAAALGALLAWRRLRKGTDLTGIFS